MSNPYRVIKHLVFVTGFCIVSCTTALAQQSLFVYLQTENPQPFYVQMGEKVYSSSPIGHLIISGLPDNTCNFEIGFPQRGNVIFDRVWRGARVKAPWLAHRASRGPQESQTNDQGQADPRN